MAFRFCRIFGRPAGTHAAARSCGRRASLLAVIITPSLAVCARGGVGQAFLADILWQTCSSHSTESPRPPGTRTLPVNSPLTNYLTSRQVRLFLKLRHLVNPSPLRAVLDGACGRVGPSGRASEARAIVAGSSQPGLRTPEYSTRSRRQLLVQRQTSGMDRRFEVSRSVRLESRMVVLPRG
jgi:hypothetical protein